MTTAPEARLHTTQDVSERSRGAGQIILQDEAALRVADQSVAPSFLFTRYLLRISAHRPGLLTVGFRH
jgi:hypothetical protein